jgi:signal transduction histidine kinase/CheY-like chemotaxis protein
VVVGANVNEFHLPATITEGKIRRISSKYIDHLDKEKTEIIDFFSTSATKTIFDLTMLTVAMILLVILIAIQIAIRITNRIKILIDGISVFKEGNYEYRINAKGYDEISQLSNEFDKMADSLSQTMKELEQSKKEAIESERIKSLFLTNMSHEIRTPLNGITGLCNILMKLDVNSEQQQNYLDSLKTSTNSLLCIIDDILDFSKINKGKIKLKKESFNIENIIKETIQIFELRAIEKKLVLHYEIAEDVPDSIIGDPDRIRQIFINLVGNAIKFTKRGSVKIVVAVIDQTKKDNHIKLKFSVIDQGIGILEDKQKIIFNIFEQIDNEYSRQYNGTGLGLAICKELVERMNGEIGVESKFGIGSTFWFTVVFEYTNGYHISIDDGSIVQKRSYENKKVLVVEDNAINALVTKNILEELNITVVEAGSGTEALIVYERGGFDLIFMDIQMPRMDGFEVIKRLREYEKKNNISAVPIVALTAHAMKEHKKQCLDNGADGYLSKPIKYNELISVLDEYLVYKK